LPTPLSPRISTVTSLSATWSMISDTCRMAALSPQPMNASLLIVAQLLAEVRELADQTRALDGLPDRGVERDFAQPLRVVGLDHVVRGRRAARPRRWSAPARGRRA
jgi:hypothetical protein